ncbi:MAG: hypothetical protein LBP35_05815 [Candidatus Ancillula trichonymphae]|jgi:shikimate dehydrogenase|nr:hypothetical protein [Candidatus Ancillula trichonymphae]
MQAAVIGTPVEQSKSPILHSAAYAALGIAGGWKYTKCEVSEDSLRAFVQQLDGSWAGFSVTMPLKSAVIQYLDEISAEATQTNAVNTVVVKTDENKTRGLHLSGCNTDIYGIRQAFYEASSLANHEELQGGGIILGSGATARSAANALKTVLQNSASKRITVISRRKPAWIQEVELDWCSFENHTRINQLMNSSEYAVSTLPWGAAKSLLPTIFPQTFPKVLECAFPKVLPFSIGGERMLIHQAVLQVELMTEHLGLRFEADKIVEVMATALKKEARV